MTELGPHRRLRSRRVALAAAGVGATVIAAATIVGTTETVASFTDSVWAGAGFSTGTFGIEGSLERDGEYDNHSDSPLTLNFGAPISLAPGETSYAGLYLRRTETTEDPAAVSVSGPTGEDQSWPALWNDDITFVAKAAPATTTTECNEMIHTEPQWINLYDSGTLAAPERVPDSTFTLGEPVADLQDGEPYMVCFEFTLSTTPDQSSNGQSAFPTWTLTAESRQP